MFLETVISYKYDKDISVCDTLRNFEEIIIRVLRTKNVFCFLVSSIITIVIHP